MMPGKTNAPEVTEARERQQLQRNKMMPGDADLVNLGGPVETVLRELTARGCNPRRSGSGWQARCPSHGDSTPSLSISEGADGRALLKCHAGCELGSILSTINLKATDLFPEEPQRARRNGHPTSRKETKQLRPDLEPVIEALHQALRRDESAQRLLLESRGITLETAKRYRIGWDAKQRRWSIPIRRPDGVAVGLKYHRSDSGQSPKVISESGSSVALFGADHLLADGSLVVITEGELDSAVVWQASGLHAVSGSGGAAAVKAEWIKLLHGHPVVLWPDNDERGREGLSRWLDHLGPDVRNGAITSVRIVRKRLPECKDATDCLLKHGPEIIRALIESAFAEVHSAPETKPREAVRPFLVNLAKVEPEAVSFLWEPYFPRGKVTLLEGEPGDGKTTFALMVCAHVTNGRGWPGPDGELGPRREPGRVLYLSCEDGLADTIRPRLDRAGGDPTRFVALTGLTNGEPIFLSDHTMVEAAMAEVRPALMVVDPIQGFLGARVDMHRANEVRPLMARLGNLAETYGCAVVVIRHLRKSSGDHRLHRGLGSIDFTAHARSILRIGRDPNDSEARAAIQVKASCSAEGPAIGFRITDRGFEWTGVSSLSIQDMEAGETDRSARDEAMDFLKEALAEGPVPVRDLRGDAEGAGLAWRTIELAKRALGVRAMKSGFGRGGTWQWHLP
ncbi:MAG: DNA primase [bacterium]|nr:DNA primase [bacterium]